MELTRINNSPVQLHNEFNRLFSRWGAGESQSAVTHWVPAADVIEHADRFELYLDVPGIDPDQIDIKLDKGVLYISGERNYPADIDGKAQQLQRMERGQGHFHRQFVLPDTVDTDNVQAKVELGVLQVSIGKQARSQPKRITVNAS